MSVKALKFLNCNGVKNLRLTRHFFKRMASTDQSCPSNPNQPDSSKPHEPCSTKVEPCPPPPASLCNKPEPCPPMPHCPPIICPPNLNSGDPCHYCPPPCPDPDFPDVSRLKKSQCLFQEENDLPVYLKKGNSDALIVQATYLLSILSVILAVYNTYLLIVK